MSYQDSQFLKTFKCDAAVSKYALVKINSDNEVLECAANTDIPIGIAQRGGAAGDFIEVCLSGPSFAIAGGAITLGTHQLLMPAANGKLVAYAGGGGTEYSVAEFIHNETAADNDEILVIYRGASIQG